MYGTIPRIADRSNERTIDASQAMLHVIRNGVPLTTPTSIGLTVARARALISARLNYEISKSQGLHAIRPPDQTDIKGFLKIYREMCELALDRAYREMEALYELGQVAQAFYAERLESVGEWFRQLWAESLGKTRPETGDREFDESVLDPNLCRARGNQSQRQLLLQ